MNERIEKFIEQSTTIECGVDNGFDRVIFDKEKFADLIIQDILRTLKVELWKDKPTSFHIKNIEERYETKIKPQCSVCGTTENVKWVGGSIPYLCNSNDCIPF